jgi:tetratricopeptide (TPR) repeat protein
MLSPQERKFFERFSIFTGGWTLEATNAVCTDEDMDEFLALDLLTNLVDKSLVTLDRHPGREPRYRFLEPVRQYARDRLERSGMLPFFARKHLDYYLGFAQKYAEELDGENQVAALNRLEIERENLRSALAWSLESPETARESVRMVVALGRFWLVRGNLKEGRQWMFAVLAQKNDCNCPDERAVALNLMGMMAYRQSDYHASKAAWEESLEISQQMGETGLRGVHLALTGLAMVASEVGNYDDTIRLLHEALEITRRLGDGLSEADILRNLGWGVMRTGDYPQARTYLEQAEGLFRRYNERVGLSSTISGLGEVATRLGELEKAKTLLEEALALRRELDNKWGIGATLGTLAWVAMEAKDLPAARQYLSESMEVRQELGDKGGIAWCLEKMAQVSQMQGGMQQAALLFGAAAALRLSIHSVIDLADQAEYEALLNTIREAIGEKMFQRKWEEGAALSLDQAVAAARQNPAE